MVTLVMMVISGCLFSVYDATSCPAVSKETEMLKCKLNDMSRDFKDMKEEIKRLKIKQNIDIKQLRLEQEVELQHMQSEQEDMIKKLNRNHKTKISDLEKQLNDLKNISTQQDIALVAMSRERASWSTYCQLLPVDICGTCTCRDDDVLNEKYYCDCMNFEARRDCLEHFEDGLRINGLYKIHLNNMKMIRVFCDQTSDGGGWTMAQRRTNGIVNFYQNWDIYKKGFGTLQREFWLGNDDIFLLTLQAAYPTGTELRIDMRDWNETILYAKYETFQIDNELLNYTLHVTGFSGNCGDSLTYHNGMQFSTYDRDNDADYRACSTVFRGAWWYKSCHYSNLNGVYRWKDEDQPFARCIVWYTFRGYEYSLKSVEIKLRRKVIRNESMVKFVRNDEMVDNEQFGTDGKRVNNDKLVDNVNDDKDVKHDAFVNDENGDVSLTKDNASLL